jgi:hypothetical protein
MHHGLGTLGLLYTCYNFVSLVNNILSMLKFSEIQKSNVKLLKF